MSATVSSPESITTSVTEELQRLRRAAYRKYVELLNTFTSGVDLDAKALTALRNALSALGKSSDDVSPDARTLAQSQILRARIATARGSFAAQAQALAAVRAHDAETAALLKERKREYFALYAEYEKIGHTRAVARTAIGDLNKLIAENPELLEGEPPATPQDMR